MKLIDLQKYFDDKLCPLCNNSIEGIRCKNCNLTLDKHNDNYSCRINGAIKLTFVVYGGIYYHISDKMYLTIFSGNNMIYNSWLSEYDTHFKLTFDTTFDDVKELLNKMNKIEVFK